VNHNFIKLSNQDQLEAAYLLTQAFWDNPAHTLIYPDPHTRFENLRLLMEKNLNAQFAVGNSFAKKSKDGRIIAMGFWHPPKSLKANLFQLIRFGFLSLPIRQGIQPFKRILNTSKQIEDNRNMALEGRESWYLNNMVVAANYRGKGIGGSLMREQLSAIVDPTNQPASLTTQKPENVRFYQSLGFEIRDETPIIDGNKECQNWIMIREPKI